MEQDLGIEMDIVWIPQHSFSIQQWPGILRRSRPTCGPGRRPRSVPRIRQWAPLGRSWRQRIRCFPSFRRSGSLRCVARRSGRSRYRLPWMARWWCPRRARWTSWALAQWPEVRKHKWIFLLEKTDPELVLSLGAGPNGSIVSNNRGALDGRSSGGHVIDVGVPSGHFVDETIGGEKRMCSEMRARWEWCIWRDRRRAVLIGFEKRTETRRMRERVKREEMFACHVVVVSWDCSDRLAWCGH